MALINCPECNEQISSTVSQCVHCGVKICVCPECEKVYTETPEQCAECGYIFKKSAESSEKEPPCNTIPDIKVKCRSENFHIFITEHLGLIISIISWILVIFLSVKLISFFDSLKHFDGLLNIENEYVTLKNLIIFLAIVEIIREVYDDIKYTLIGHLLSAWAKSRSVDLRGAIKNTFATKYKNTVEKEKKTLAKDIKQAVYAEFLGENRSQMTKRIVNHTIHAICTAIGFVLFASFAIENIEIIKIAELTKSDLLGIEGWSVSMVVNWWKVIADAILVLFNVIYRIYVISNLKAERNKWVNTVMPECYEEYQKISIDLDY